ncbi:hypothetical protein [Streptomyces sp. NPDC101776]|uniref:hypothetical protein n=1 Tax=Streptomyces sp. NPDC101776 TaxID=3366146 RepID=UPI0037FAE62A
MAVLGLRLGGVRHRGAFDAHAGPVRGPRETVYQAVYPPHRGGLERTPGLLRTGWPARRRRRRPDERATRFIDPGTPISHRPDELNDRQTAGSWEGDLIVGKGNRSAIGTLVFDFPRLRPSPSAPPLNAPGVIQLLR